MSFSPLKLFNKSFSAFSRFAAGRDFAKPFKSSDESMAMEVLASNCQALCACKLGNQLCIT